LPTKTITIRDLRQRWPETEKTLQVENELIITRDGQPVAKLVRVAEEKAKRKRWNPEEHAARIKKILGSKVFPTIDKQLAEDRADHKL
jgi:antitoxin (DNA-binding transcriptional repressor) of toxin-antitoxin stability system